MHQVRFWVVGLVGLCVLGAAWGFAAEIAPPAEQAAPHKSIVVSIPPLEGLIRPLLKGVPAKDWTLEVLVPPGVSEHGYELPPSLMGKLAGADVVVLVGLDLEPQEEQVVREHPKDGRRVIRLADAAKIAAHPKPGEEAALADEDEGNAADPHIWLDPGAVERALPVIAKQLEAEFPASSEQIAKAEQEMVKKVGEVDHAYKERLKAAPTRTLVVGHDAWSYLARRYDLKVVPLKGLNAEESTPASLAAAIRAIRDRQARAVCVEPQFAAQAGQRVADAAHVPVLVLDPLGNGDWFKMMNSNLDVIAQALGITKP